MTFTGPQARPAISRAIVVVMGTLCVAGMALVGSASIASAGAAAGDQQVIEFKGGGTDPVNSPVDQMMQRFVKALAERTGNKIRLTYFAGAQLGGERDIVEGVQLGTVGMAVTGPPIMKARAAPLSRVPPRELLMW